jgi:hypothetical protein
MSESCMTLLNSGQSCHCVAFVVSTKAEGQKRAKKGRAVR